MLSLLGNGCIVRKKKLKICVSQDLGSYDLPAQNIIIVKVRIFSFRLFRGICAFPAPCLSERIIRKEKENRSELRKTTYIDTDYWNAI